MPTDVNFHFKDLVGVSEGLLDVPKARLQAGDEIALREQQVGVGGRAGVQDGVQRG